MLLVIGDRLMNKNQLTDRSTNKAAYRIACMRLKLLNGESTNSNYYQYKN